MKLDLTDNKNLSVYYVNCKDQSRQEMLPYQTTATGYSIQLTDLGLTTDDFDNITMTDGGVLDKTTGVVSYKVLPKNLTYTYYTNQKYADEKGTDVLLYVSTPIAVTFDLGDINADRAINASDALQALRHSVY